MVNIDEFNTKLLAKYGIMDNNIRTKILIFLVGELSNEIGDTSYLNLKNMFESEEALLQSEKRKICLRSEESDNNAVIKHTLFIDLYEAGQNDNILKKRAVLNDYNYGHSESIYINGIRILELNYDGSVVYINVERYEYSNTKYKIEVKYYNEDTAKLIGTEKENIDVYELLDDFCIHCDHSVSKSYDTSSYNDLLPKIDECKNLLEKKINENMTLKMEDK